MLIVAGTILVINLNKTSYAAAMATLAVFGLVGVAAAWVLPKGAAAGIASDGVDKLAGGNSGMGERIGTQHFTDTGDSARRGPAGP